MVTAILVIVSSKEKDKWSNVDDGLVVQLYRKEFEREYGAAKPNFTLGYADFSALRR